MTEQHEWEYVHQGNHEAFRLIHNMRVVGNIVSTDLAMTSLVQILNEYEKLKKATEALSAEVVSKLVVDAEQQIIEGEERFNLTPEEISALRSYRDTLEGK